MKKSICILVTLFAATFANAQITLEHTFDHEISAGWGIAVLEGGKYGDANRIIGNYLYEKDEENQKLYIYDANNCNLLKTFTTEEGTSYCLISRGIFTTDNKWSFVTFKQTTTKGWDIGYEPCNYYYEIKIQSEDGSVIETLSTQAFCEDGVTLLKVGNDYKLVVEKNNKYDYYSLPGNGEVTDVSEVSAPRRNARKYINNDQVLIDSNERTYTVQGNEAR